MVIKFLILLIFEIYFTGASSQCLGRILLGADNPSPLYPICFTHRTSRRFPTPQVK